MNNTADIFVDIIAGKHPDIESKFLDSLTGKYPWFTAARHLAARIQNRRDPLLELHSIYHRPMPSGFEIPADEFMVESTINPTTEPIDLIDRFLKLEDLKIVPKDNIDENNAAAQSEILDLTDDIVSEELAEVYKNQGLNREAVEIYEKLSLLYPEKSVYFAEIIRGIPNDQE